MSSHYIEFVGLTGTEKVQIQGKGIKTLAKEKQFTGTIFVYNEKEKILKWKIGCKDGVFNGTCIKYMDYVPSTLYGKLTGYLSANWRQVEFECTFRDGMIDGQVLFYTKDGSREFLLTFKNDQLEGEQKHYILPDVRVIHHFHENKYQKSSLQYKNWLPRFYTPKVDEFASYHLLLQRLNTFPKR